MLHRSSNARGMSLIDVIVGIALMLILFLSLFGILRASLLLSTLASEKAGATAVAQVQMEYLRGLAYDSVGTVGGIPAGSVPQDTTTTENGIPYLTHTFISYIDDPADGLGVNDTNGITTDYKRARVSTSYTIGGMTRSVVLVSNFAPPGIETTTGGGTLQINVVDATGAPIEGASVTMINASTSPTVNLTTFSDVSGTVYLPGAATSSAYQVSVTKSGYSSAQTYARNSTNQNPNPGYLTVVRNQTTTGTFAIDRLATLSIASFSPIATSTFSDSFADTSKLALTSSTTVTGGALTLLSGETNGTARSVATTSSSLVQWGQAMATTSIPANTLILFRIYDGSGNLIPDTVLPGNATGFSSMPISLTSISTSSYPSLALGAELGTTGSSLPSITGWSLSYSAGPVPLPNIVFTITGKKTTGSTGAGAPIYKTTISTTSGSDGTQILTLEWDSYSLSVNGHDLVDACPSPPYSLAPAANMNVSLIFGPSTTNSLRILVTDTTGAPVSNAQVSLSRSGFSKTVKSSSCGSAYFGGITSANDYSVVITKAGYTTTTFTAVSATGASTYGASFP